MLPLVLGAYKEKEDHKGDDYLEFIGHTYNDMLESLYESGRFLYFRECEASHNFVFEPVDAKPQKCNATIVYKGNVVIYCDDATLGVGREIDANDMRIYFLNKLLKQTVKYCNFMETIANISDFKPCMQELKDKTMSELDVIKSILLK